MKLGKNGKAAVKALTWRLVAAADTFLLTYLITGKVTAAVGVVGFEFMTKSAIYFAHERAWDFGMAALTGAATKAATA